MRISRGLVRFLLEAVFLCVLAGVLVVVHPGWEIVVVAMSLAWILTVFVERAFARRSRRVAQAGVLALPPAPASAKSIPGFRPPHERVAPSARLRPRAAYGVRRERVERTPVGVLRLRFSRRPGIAGGYSGRPGIRARFKVRAARLWLARGPFMLRMQGSWRRLVRRMTAPFVRWSYLREERRTARREARIERATSKQLEATARREAADALAAEQREADRVAAEAAVLSAAAGPAEEERLAAERAEAAQREADRAAAEAALVAAAAARGEEERAAAERVAAEQREAEGVAAARAEAERLAEARRITAEREAEQLRQAERVAALERERVQSEAAELATAGSAAAERREARPPRQRWRPARRKPVLETPPGTTPAPEQPEQPEQPGSAASAGLRPPVIDVQPAALPPAIVDEPARAPAPVRVSMPREWNIWELETLARDDAGVDQYRDEERSLLLLHLRPFASAEGILPADFDDLVREAFGDLLTSRDRV